VWYAGEKYLNHLLEKGEVAKAAELSPKILKRDGALWEKWIIEFARRRELKVLCAAIHDTTHTTHSVDV
jgi:hypothetical protein